MHSVRNATFMIQIVMKDMLKLILRKLNLKKKLLKYKTMMCELKKYYR